MLRLEPCSSRCRTSWTSSGKLHPGQSGKGLGERRHPALPWLQTMLCFPFGMAWFSPGDATLRYWARRKANRVACSDSLTDRRSQEVTCEYISMYICMAMLQMVSTHTQKCFEIGEPSPQREKRLPFHFSLCNSTKSTPENTCSSDLPLLRLFAVSILFVRLRRRSPGFRTRKIGIDKHQFPCCLLLPPFRKAV